MVHKRQQKSNQIQPLFFIYRLKTRNVCNSIQLGLDVDSSFVSFCSSKSILISVLNIQPTSLASIVVMHHFGTPIPYGRHRSLRRHQRCEQPTQFPWCHPGNRAWQPGRGKTRTWEWARRSTKGVGKRNRRHAAPTTKNSYPCWRT